MIYKYVQTHKLILKYNIQLPETWDPLSICRNHSDKVQI